MDENDIYIYTPNHVGIYQVIDYEKVKSLEIWMDIPKQLGRYQVSNYGRVKRVARLVNSAFGAKREIKEKILKIIILQHISFIMH